jgi:hypothetical protein
MQCRFDPSLYVQALAAVKALNQRWFGGRQIGCEFWDGVTDYRPKVLFIVDHFCWALAEGF